LIQRRGIVPNEIKQTWAKNNLITTYSPMAVTHTRSYRKLHGGVEKKDPDETDLLFSTLSVIIRLYSSLLVFIKHNHDFILTNYNLKG